MKPPCAGMFKLHKILVPDDLPWRSCTEPRSAASQRCSTSRNSVPFSSCPNILDSTTDDAVKGCSHRPLPDASPCIHNIDVFFSVCLPVPEPDTVTHSQCPYGGWYPHSVLPISRLLQAFRPALLAFQSSLLDRLLAFGSHDTMPASCATWAFVFHAPWSRTSPLPWSKMFPLMTPWFQQSLAGARCSYCCWIRHY